MTTNVTSIAPRGREAEPRPAHDETTTPVVAKRKRTPLLIALMSGVALATTGAWWAFHVGRESTDDAQVEGRVMSVSARVAGQVLRVRVADNAVVEAGDVLVELDPADFGAKADLARADVAASRAAVDGARSALALAEKSAPATLVQAQGGLTSAASSITSARASIEQARADLAAAAARRSLAELDAKRARALVNDRALPVAELDARQADLDEAIAREAQARARVASAEAALAGSNGGLVFAKGRLDAADTGAEQIASARAALSLAEARAAQTEAALKLAELNLSYTTVKAPRRGVVSRRSVEEGQTVSPERPLLAVVPLDDVWVVANFKEDQLAEMRPGQPATVRVDTYGGREIAAHVESIAGGTGARFALLPPDNATGNFVKVVQRVPVLLRLDGASGVDLRPGMSADITVRTRGR